LWPAVAGRDHAVTRGVVGWPAVGRLARAVVSRADILGYLEDLAHRWAKPHQLR
jgi:hypothetical protein